MNAHTPGTWEIHSRHESRDGHEIVTRYLALPGHDYIEVSRIVDPTPEQDAEARANGRLIAAAPAPASALRRIIEARDEMMRDPTVSAAFLTQRVDGARLVLAEAEGQR